MASLRLRYPSAVERYDTFLLLFPWPFLFFIPDRRWPWLIVIVVVSPALLRWLFQRAAEARVMEVSPRRKDGGVDLVDAAGHVVEHIDDGEVDAVARVMVANGRVTDLRIDRRGRRALLFPADSAEKCAELAARLGIDMKASRRRYVASSPAVRLGLVILLGFLCMGDLVFFHEAPGTKVWLLRFLRFVWMPLAALAPIPMLVDVGRDGVAWRWLFIQKFAPFSSVQSVRTHPPDARIDKPHRVCLVTDGHIHRFLVLGGSPLLADVREVFEGARDSKRADAEDAKWLVRRKNEATVAWIKRLQATNAEAGGYRSAPTSHLWSIAEDPEALAAVRCGAVLVLCSNKRARSRARVIATRTVGPALRSALDGIADELPAEELALRLEPLFDMPTTAERRPLRARPPTRGA